MNQPLKDVESYFREKLSGNGPTARGVDWKDEASQHLRFDIINRQIDFAHRPSILDVGCGTAEYLNHAALNGLSIEYLGIDIVEEMVRCANDRFGPQTALLGDVFTDFQGRAFDHVIASGTFNAKLGTRSSDWRRFFYDNLTRMFELCRRSLVFNCMSPRVDFKYRRLYYPDAGDLVKFIVQNLSRDFVIDHSYPLYEMTVSVTKPAQ